MIGHAPQIKSKKVLHKERIFDIEYLYRQGSNETIVFIHGLGGCKENFWEAYKTVALSDHTLIAFDNPGTGNSTYYNDFPLTIDDLVSITSEFIEQMNLKKFILSGTSMGGLTTLLYLKRGGLKRVKGYINIEGNFLPEDCMFSSKVVKYDFETFESSVFPATIRDMKKKGNPGYHLIANNLELNTNVFAYFHYSFQTVSYSATGELLDYFIHLPVSKIFIYGDENNHLSYLPTLKENHIAVKAISASNHFIFYDNPKELYENIAAFIHPPV